MEIFYVMWQNIPLCGRIFHGKSWKILPHHMHGLYWNQQWFIDSKHGFGQ
jgi:hypothetical protein